MARVLAPRIAVAVTVAVAVVLGSMLGGVATGWARNLSSSEVKRAIDIHVRVLLEEAGTGLHIVTLAHRAGLSLPDGVVSWRVKQDMAQLEPGHHRVPVAALVDGFPVAETEVVLELKQRLKTPMLTRYVKRGERVTRGDVQMREWVLARPLRGRVRDSRDVIGMVATQGVREGRPLVSKWFEPPLAVDRGDRVRILLVRGGLTIETVGVALQSGRKGERIAIRNPQSRAIYDALITALGEARVQAW